MGRFEFLVVAAALVVTGFAIAAVLTPPDPYSQLRAAAVILLLVLPVSYWLAYSRGVSVRD